MKKELNRRVFLERLGACALGGAVLSQGMGHRARAQNGGFMQDPASGPAGANQTAWSKPSQVYTNPNILIILVDQMRWPRWLSSSQLTTLDTIMLPNIFGKLRDKSYVFQQYYTAATVCTASRGALLTGLYAPQTAVYLGADKFNPNTPSLNPAFPTWGSALPKLNSAYAGNVWWFGKWHLSTCTPSASQFTRPLQPYGFNTGYYPGGPGCADPTGVANEGTDGGSFNGGNIWASDSMIAGDFAEWISGKAPYGTPGSTWCATVSLINPHDIASAPRSLEYPYTGPSGSPWFQPQTWFTTNTSLIPNDVTNPPSGWPQLYTPDNYPSNGTLPSPWNWENLAKLGAEGLGPSQQYCPGGASWPTNGIKPDAQLAFQCTLSQVKDWTLFLNQYYWLQQSVDQQVGNVLNALYGSPYAANTIIIFASDHGEYAGSHGLHDKGYAAYDESIHVPLYVQFPGQPSGIVMDQMCSSVDFFRLICDLGTQGLASGAFAAQYPDQANRQQIWDFLYKNSGETRLAQNQLSGAAAGLTGPYIFHTCDMSDDAKQTSKVHIGCLRGKSGGSQSAKLALYWEWGSAPGVCTTYPDSTPPDYEFYDYTSTNSNSNEVGNNYNGWTGTANPSLQSTYLNAMGNWGGWSSPDNAPGLINAELDATLTGTGTDGKPLSQAQATAQQAYLTYMFGTACPAGST